MNIAPLAPIALAAGLALAVTGLATRAAVADFGPGEVVAVDTTAPAARPAAARMVGIDATVIAGLSVTGAGGRPVTVTATGERPRTLTPAATSAAVFRRLTPGRVYTVTVAGTRVGTAVPLAAVGPAFGLAVSTTGTPDEVLLRWSHRPAKAEGRVISYTVTATPVGVIGASGETAAEITGTTTATATRLVVDPATRYTFTLTPRNPVSSGRPTTATMTRTLREMTGATDVPTAPAPAPAVVVTPAPTPPPAPAAPGASTKTDYVCPDGFSPTGDACTDTKAYTFHSETVAYTFHTGVVGSHVVTHPPTHCDYLPNPNSPTGLDIYCYGGYDETVLDYGPVKDATPDGYADTGTAWTHQVKDPAPAGYVDDGTAWVKTVAKVATVVPA
jgi:hypothetical protein